MRDAIRIGKEVYTEVAEGEFHVPLTSLSSLRFTEVPFYSDLKIGGPPGSADSYDLEITARHAGGPHNEEFTLIFHVTFQLPGAPTAIAAVQTVNRRLQTVKRCFRETAAALGLRLGPEWVPFFANEGMLHGDVSFYRDFQRSDDPVLADTVAPFVVRFNELLSTKDPLLFLCHASEDKPFVEQLCAFLDAEDVAVCV